MFHWECFSDFGMYKQHSRVLLKCRLPGIAPKDPNLVSLGATQKPVFLTSTRSDPDNNGPDSMLPEHELRSITEKYPGPFCLYYCYFSLDDPSSSHIYLAIFHICAAFLPWSFHFHPPPSAIYWLLCSLQPLVSWLFQCEQIFSAIKNILT